MKKLIGGNWKMNVNLDTISAMESFFEKITDYVDVFIAVPFIYLKECHEKFNNLIKPNIKLAAQDLSAYEDGTYTGQISARMLKDYSVEYVLIGHSEIRTFKYESNKLINEKLKIAIKYNIQPVLCIGETLTERESNGYLEYLKVQFEESTKNLEGCSFDIAYEPVWAIGTGKVAENDQISEVLIKIKGWMEIKKITGRCIYGGSVSSKNIDKLNDIKELDGYLVGNASLSEDFIKIISKSV